MTEAPPPPGSRALGPVYLVTERFGPGDGDRWRDYIAWCGLTQLAELVTIDTSQCRSVTDEILADDWPHIVNADFLLHFFVDLDHLLRRCGGAANRNLLCVFRDPLVHPEPPPSAFDFRFEGYDLLDLTCGPSALTNCGGFPLAFANDELTPHGLLPSLRRAREVQSALAEHYPDEHHAQCDVWAIFRAAGKARPAAGNGGRVHP